MAFLLHRDDRRGSGSKLPRGISLRRGTADDETGAFDVMRRTMNSEMSWANHSSMRHHLRASLNCSFWVAEDSPRFGSPRVVGYARSIVRERVWSLTEFFVLPSQHRQGVGGSLLANCMQDGDAAGADTRIVLASHHPDADSLYIRRSGCLPLLPMMLLAGSANSLRAPDASRGSISDNLLTGLYDDRFIPGMATLTVTHGSDVVAEPITARGSQLDEINALDRDIVGYARPAEHLHWIAEMGGDHGAARAFRSRRGDRQIIGYSYVGAHCSGPTLAVDPEDLPRFFYHVGCAASALYRPGGDIGLSFMHPADQYCAVAGINKVMLRWLLASGWQIVFQYLFMCTRPIGKFDRYIGHNPLYVL